MLSKGNNNLSIPPHFSQIKFCDFIANLILSWVENSKEPTPVMLSLIGKCDMMASSIVLTVQAGFHDSGWKRVIDKQIFEFTSNLPLGVKK